MLPLALSNMSAPAAVLVKLELTVMPLPYTEIGPLIATALLRDMSVVLLARPIVNPETLLANDQLLPNVCAEPKLSVPSNDKTLTVPVVLNVAVLFNPN